MTLSTAFNAAAAAGLAIALYALLRARASNHVLRVRLSVLAAQRRADEADDTVQFARAGWFYDDGSDGDPTWYARALSFGHDPELSAAERRELAPLFEPFDRLMTRMIAQLQTVGVPA